MDRSDEDSAEDNSQDDEIRELLDVWLGSPLNIDVIHTMCVNQNRAYYMNAQQTSDVHKNRKYEAEKRLFPLYKHSTSGKTLVDLYTKKAANKRGSTERAMKRKTQRIIHARWHDCDIFWFALLFKGLTNPARSTKSLHFRIQCIVMILALHKCNSNDLDKKLFGDAREENVSVRSQLITGCISLYDGLMDDHAIGQMKRLLSSLTEAVTYLKKIDSNNQRMMYQHNAGLDYGDEVVHHPDMTDIDMFIKTYFMAFDMPFLLEKWGIGTQNITNVVAEVLQAILKFAKQAKGESGNDCRGFILTILRLLGMTLPLQQFNSMQQYKPPRRPPANVSKNEYVRAKFEEHGMNGGEQCIRALEAVRKTNKGRAPLATRIRRAFDNVMNWWSKRDNWGQTSMYAVPLLLIGKLTTEKADVMDALIEQGWHYYPSRFEFSQSLTFEFDDRPDDILRNILDQIYNAGERSGEIKYHIDSVEWPHITFFTHIDPQHHQAIEDCNPEKTVKITFGSATEIGTMTVHYKNEEDLEDFMQCLRVKNEAFDTILRDRKMHYCFTYAYQTPNRRSYLLALNMASTWASGQSSPSQMIASHQPTKSNLDHLFIDNDMLYDEAYTLSVEPGANHMLKFTPPAQ